MKYRKKKLRQFFKHLLSIFRGEIIKKFNISTFLYNNKIIIKLLSKANGFKKWQLYTYNTVVSFQFEFHTMSNSDSCGNKSQHRRMIKTQPTSALCVLSSATTNNSVGSRSGLTTTNFMENTFKFARHPDPPLNARRVNIDMYEAQSG